MNASINDTITIDPITSEEFETFFTELGARRTFSLDDEDDPFNCWGYSGSEPFYTMPWCKIKRKKGKGGWKNSMSFPIIIRGDVFNEDLDIIRKLLKGEEVHLDHNSDHQKYFESLFDCGESKIKVEEL